MADVQNEDSIPYDKEKESFLRELQEFHEKRGTPFREGPKIGGKLVDLHRLYDLVTSEGGWVKVNSRNDWDKVLEELDLPVDCVNCSVAVKQVYLRYLDRYEELYFFGEIEERGTGDDEEDSRSRKLTMRSLNSFPHMYNHMQHCVNESLRECNGLSIDLYQASEYDKLALSLISPLANEQDFAINVCTLISHEGKHCLKLQKHPRILYYLLGHAAVFNHSSLRQVFAEHYTKIRGTSMSKFWHDIVCDSRLVRLIDESRFEENEYEDDIPEECLITGEGSGLNLQPEDHLLFCLGRTLGTQEVVGQRVLQVATILRNLTFVQENINVMSTDLTFLRFVLLCCGSNWSNLHQMGWDMLGNVAQDITILCPLMPEILDLTVQGFDSQDRAQILSSLEVLNKLGQNEKNEDYFLKYLKAKVYDRICSFLSIQDIMMLIYTLECLYSLSSMGEKACDAIVRVHGVLDTLVSLVTVEAQSYGPKACIQMKVVETVSGVAGTNVQNGSVTVTQTSVANPSMPSTSQTVTVASTVHVQQLSSVSTQSPRPQLVTQGQVLHPTSQVTPTQVVMQSPQKTAQTQVTHMTPTSKIVQVVHSTPSQVSQSQIVHVSPAMTKVAQTQVATSVQQQVTSTAQFQVTQTQVQISQAPLQIQGTSPGMQVQSRIAIAPSSSTSSPQQVVQENERFVLLWLRNTFEPHAGSRIEQQELYKKYIEYCVKIGRRGVIAPIHFHRYVKSVFGSNVGPVTISSASGDASQEFFDGIRLRAEPISLPNAVGQLTQTLSPLLKAQLSAPLKPTAVTPQSKLVQRQHQQIIIQQGQDNRQIICASPTQMQAGTSQTTPSVISSVIAHSASPPPIISQSQVPTISQSVGSVVSSSPLPTVLQTITSMPSTPIAVVSQSSVTTMSPTQQAVSTVLTATTSTVLTVSPSSTPMVSPSPAPSVVQTPVPALGGLQSSAPSIIQANPSNISVIEKSPASTAMPGVVIKEENILQKINGAQLSVTGAVQPVAKIVVKKEEEMETDDVVTSTSGESNSNRPLPVATLSCIKATSSLKDHEYTGNPLTLVPDIKSEPASTENSSDSAMVNGLSKASDTEDSNSKDSVPKKLMLADLLEKNIDKSEPPLANCSLRIGEKGLELVPGPEKEKPMILTPNSVSSVVGANGSIIIKDEGNPLKRSGDNVETIDIKKPKVNGNSPPKEEETPEDQNVSSSAANLYAALAADALEDEPIVEEAPKPPVIVTSVNQPRQILLTTGSQIAQSVIVGGQHYIVAQPQTGFVQGQQTVLVAQTSQQQGMGAKTIIFLQPQNVSGGGGGQQKVLVQTASPPPLIATSQASPILRPKTCNSPAQSSSLLQQAIMRQNQTKTIQVQSSVQSPQKQVVQQPMLVQQQNVIQLQNTAQQQQNIQQATMVQQASVQQPTVVHQVVQQSSVVQQAPPLKSETPVSSSSQLNPVKPTIAVATTSTGPGTSSSTGIQPITNTPSSSTGAQTSPQTKTVEKGKFLCEWRGCMRSFKSSGEVYLHACEAHCPEAPKDIQCLWQRCDTMKRKRFSHMTHLYNRHCNPEVMKLAAERSKQISQGRTEIPPPSPPMPHPGYAPNAALLAINRHASDYVNPKELQDENEGPVTKSIRLTSALILRNLVIYSSNGRRHMTRFEPHLANVALSGVESSRTIAHVLYDMSEHRYQYGG